MDAKKRIDFSIIRLDRGTQKIENLFPLILYIGLDGKILDCSSHAAETLGYRNKKELSGMPLITTICAPSSREKAGTLFLEWQKTGQLKNEQLQIVTREGRELDVLMNMDVILDKRGDPLYAVVTLWNMTEQRRMIDRFKRLAHDLGERTKELNLLYSIDEISRKQEITIDEVLQRTVQLIPPAWQYPEITGCCIILGHRKFKTSNFRKTEWMQRADILVDSRKSGAVEVCYLKKKPERDEGPFLKEERNLIDSVAVRLGQIIEQKHFEEAIKTSEEKFRLLFEFAPDAYYLNDLKGVFIDGNRAAEKLTGFKRDELIGKNFLKLKLLPPDQIPKAAALLAQNLRGKPTGPDEFHLIRKDGTRVPAEIRTHPVKIKGQTLVLGIARDITERKEAETTLQRRLEFEKIVSNVSTRFVGLSDLDDAINTSLREIGKFCEVSRAYVFIFHEERNTMSNTHEWCAEGVSPQIDNLKNLPCRMFPWWMAKLQRGETIHIRDVSKLPPEAINEKEILEDQDIKSLLVFPLHIGRKLSGFIGFDNVLLSGEWSREDLSILRITAEIIGSALEHKKVEGILKDSEEKYRELVNTSVDAVVSVDSQMRVILWNPAAEKMFGYKEEEMLGQSLMRIIPERYRNKVEMGFAEFSKKRSGRVIGKTLEIQGLRRDGTEIPIELSLSCRKTRRSYTATGIIRDITERKQNEARIKEERAYIDQLFESAPEAIVMADLEGRVIRVNKGFIELFGYSRDEVIGRCVDDLVAPKNLYGEAVSFTELAKEGKSVFFETVRHRKDGSPVDVSLLASPITVDDRVVAVYGIYRDITERRKAEQAIRKRSAQLELIHTIQNEIPMSMDTETLLKSAAENIGKAFGYSKVSVNLLDKETREIVNLVTWNISGTPTPRGHRQRMGEGLIGKAAELRRKIVANDVSKEPSHRLFYQTETKSELAIPLLAKDNLVGILDIQDVKKNTFTEDDVTVLQSIANYLAYVIDERQKEESLKVSLKEKEILLREIHHRVKNNLQVISSLLSLQSRHIRGRKNIEMFKESQERVKSMALIHEKLYQSQEIARINFREYIQTLVNNLFRSYKASLSQITLKMDVEDVSIGVDNAIPCGLIINELVSNSLKYAFADGRKGEIRIALHPLSEKDIELVISDNGVGMPEDLDFRKTDSLGLHLVTILAEDQLQGKINLDRSQGTEFRIRLRGVRE